VSGECEVVDADGGVRSSGVTGGVFRADDGGVEEESGGSSVAGEAEDVNREEGLGDAADGLSATVFEELRIEGGGPCCKTG